ncbi:MAG: DUF721 domain-containing protein [Alphaproteobacteria bacterium]
MRRGGAVSIGRLAQQVTAPIFADHGMGHGEIAHAWAEIVGPELAQFCQPERLTKSRANAVATLVVRVQGPRSVEVHYATPGIIEGVNALYGYRAVEQVKIVQAQPGAPTGQPSAQPIARPPTAPPANFPGIEGPLGNALARMERALALRQER